MNRQESEFLASVKTDEIGLSAKDIKKITSMLLSEPQLILITGRVNGGMNVCLSDLLETIKQSPRKTFRIEHIKEIANIKVS